MFNTFEGVKYQVKIIYSNRFGNKLEITTVSSDNVFQFSSSGELEERLEKTKNASEVDKIASEFFE